MLNRESDIKGLLPQLIQSEKGAQRKLFLQYHSYVMAIALRYLKNRSDAEELLNDVFLKVFTKIEKYKADQSFKNWLAAITVNTCIDKLRSQINIPVMLEIPLDFEPNGTKSNTWMMNEDLEILPIIQNLPSSYRIVFNLYVFEEYSHKEIAEKLNIPIGTSKSCLARAKKIIKDYYLKNPKYKKIYERRISTY